ncbi:hypothetical protein BAUCODRAFT_211979 [Baudoinia panamericana UAMH 10762]|uniref:Spindle pole body component n=1 Tax=Baudoinia panamericana (strain UAMH 10762) TaxID=717646 RepID=M2LI23_BAUPA|nr:uncharacterized protein BAUCODRAFT_211979 [Baudoinia panamericana UAMH 10762]EMC93832.1 hypothetical protein BAUCODRAFT_211979 [Baudoinia panamericana UAMH 10762]
MAHHVAIGELAARLVTNITGIGKQNNKFDRIYKDTVQGVKDHSYARTNQFDIKDRLAGLVEKFSILNREDLAQALQSRLDELPSDKKLLPEYLALLLELSDRPAEKSTLESFNAVEIPIPPATLTWEQILSEDPPTDPAIWEDVERGYHSSGDDATVDDELESEPTNSTQANSLDEEDFAALARLHVIQPDHSLLGGIHAAARALGTVAELKQASRTVKAVTELTVLRETLAMLHGLPTYCFSLSDNVMFANADLRLATAEKITVRDALDELASIGTSLLALRKWCRQAEQYVFIQSMQSCVRQHLNHMDLRLASIESTLTQPAANFKVVSLIGLRTEIEPLVQPISRLSNIILAAYERQCRDSNPFAILDSLYIGCCEAHMAGDERLCTVIGAVLFAGLRTYIKPLAVWLQTGTLSSSDNDSFFVQDARPECELHELWHKRYSIEEENDGSLSGPALMQPFAAQVFEKGKSKAFHKALVLANRVAQDEIIPTAAPELDHERVCQILEDNPLQPFSELLHSEIRTYLITVDQGNSVDLTATLLEDGGLLKIMHMIDSIYFGQDGSVMQAFAETLFDRIHRHPKAWCNRSMLTEIAQSTLSSTSAVEAGCLAVSLGNRSERAMTASVVSLLQDLELTHALPWPVQNVTRSASLPSHSAAFTLLLRVRYAIHLLSQQFFDLRKVRNFTAMQHATLKLRARFLCFLKNLDSHITCTASTLHTAMTAQLHSAENIDAMAALWTAYERRLGKCLLLATSMAPLRDAVTEVLELCECFAASWRHAGLVQGAKAMEGEFEKSLAFLVAGLRSLSRVDGESALDMLAERLHWRVG